MNRWITALARGAIVRTTRGQIGRHAAFRRAGQRQRAVEQVVVHQRRQRNAGEAAADVLEESRGAMRGGRGDRCGAAVASHRLQTPQSMYKNAAELNNAWHKFSSALRCAAAWSRVDRRRRPAAAVAPRRAVYAVVPILAIGRAVFVGRQSNRQLAARADGRFAAVANRPAWRRPCRQHSRSSGRSAGQLDCAPAPPSGWPDGSFSANEAVPRQPSMPGGMIVAQFATASRRFSAPNSRCARRSGACSPAEPESNSQHADALRTVGAARSTRPRPGRFHRRCRAPIRESRGVRWRQVRGAARRRVWPTAPAVKASSPASAASSSSSVGERPATMR